MKKNFRRWVALMAVAALVITSVAYQYSPQLKAADADDTYTSGQAQEEAVQEVVLDESGEGGATEDAAASDEETLTAEADAAVEEEAADDDASKEEAGAEGEAAEVKMPAQVLTAKASDGATITVDAAEGVLPEGASVKVTVVSAKSVMDAIEAEAGEVEDLAAYDIVILDKDGNEIQPNGDVSVKIKNADIDASADGEAAVYHVNDSKTSAEKVQDVSNPENASFTAEHFSIYVLVQTGNEDPQKEVLTGQTIELKVDESITLYCDSHDSRRHDWKVSNNGQGRDQKVNLSGFGGQRTVVAENLTGDDPVKVYCGDSNNNFVLIKVVEKTAGGGQGQQTQQYDLYFYTLVPGRTIDETGNANEIWNGMGIGKISGVNAPSQYNRGELDTANAVVTEPAAYPDITVEGVSYQYAAPGSGNETKTGYYTIEWIRTVVADGANTGNNHYNNPGVNSGTNTFHMDGQVILNMQSDYTVTFRVQEPDSDKFTIQERYSAIVPGGTLESTLTQPPMETKTSEGKEYIFDGWYLDEECTVEANFDGAIEQNTDYYGKYTLVQYDNEVVVTAESASKAYDGEPLTSSEVEWTGLPKGYRVEAAMTEASTVTNVADSPVNNVIETYTIYNDDGYDVTELFTNVTKEPGVLTIEPAEVTVTIVGHNSSFAYDGETKTVTGYEVKIGDGIDELYTTAYFDFSGTASVEGTDVGTYPMRLAEDRFTNNNDNFDVTFAVTDGKLEITPIESEVVVTIVGHNDTAPYDGEEHFISGYDVTISNDLYTENDFTFSGKAEAARTDAGTTNMGLAADQFENINGNFENVTFVVMDGFVNINPAPVTVTITGNKMIADYDGTEKTAQGYVAADNSELYTDADFTFSGTAEAKRTDAGTANMDLAKEQFANTNDNFIVTFNVTDGYVQINKINVTVTITGRSDSVTYNGQERTVTGYDVSINNDLYEEDDFTFNGTAEAKGTDAGEYPMDLSENQFTNDNDNFIATFVVTDGKLNISPISAALLVRANNDSKMYDGTALTNVGYAIAESSNDVLAPGHTVAADVEGTITDAGSVGNVISNIRVLDAGGNDVTDNYTGIKGENGTLTVTPRPVTLTSATRSWQYDGNEHTSSVVTISGEGFVEGEVSDIHATGTVTYVSEGEVTNTIAYTAGNDYKTSNYAITKNEGKLSITAKPVIITAANSSKFFDEEDPEFTGTVDGLANGGDLGTISYYRTNADVKDVGTYEDVITANYTPNDNYTVTVVPGDFQILAANADGTAAALTASGGTWQYDGTAHAVSAMVSGTAENGYVISYSVDGGDSWNLTAPTVTNVEEGTVTVDVKAERAGYKTLTDQVSISITPRKVTLTSESAEKEYDGTALERPIVAVEGGFVAGEVSDIRAIGAITEVGSVENKIVFTPNQAKYKAENYDITYKVGTLTVTAVPSYTLTIHYVDEGGNALAADYIGTFQKGAAFYIESPQIAGYTPNMTAISSDANGMPAENLEFTVVYTPMVVPVVIDTPDGPVPTPVPVAPPVVPDAPAAVVVPGPAPDAPADLVVIEDTETPLANIEDGETPLAAMDHWALLNLILTIFTTLMSVVLLVLYFKRKKDDEEAEAARMENKEDTREVRRRGVPRVLSAVWAVLMIIVFILTEDMTLPMEFTDEWTWLMVCMTIMQLCIAVFCKKVYDDERNEPDAAV